jgi:hypothetical protein
LIARRVANEPDNTARVQKAYRLIFGRSASDAEVKAGLAFLASEPLKSYEERKDTKDTKETKDTKDKNAAKKDPADEGDDGEKTGEG